MGNSNAPGNFEVTTGTRLRAILSHQSFAYHAKIERIFSQIHQSRLTIPSPSIHRPTELARNRERTISLSEFASLTAEFLRKTTS